MNKAITEILAEGYRNVLLVPDTKHRPDGETEYIVYATHKTKDPKWVGDRYRVGRVYQDQFWDEVPF